MAIAKFFGTIKRSTKRSEVHFDSYEQNFKIEL